MSDNSYCCVNQFRLLCNVTVVSMMRLTGDRTEWLTLREEASENGAAGEEARGEVDHEEGDGISSKHDDSDKDMAGKDEDTGKIFDDEGDGGRDVTAVGQDAAGSSFPEHTCNEIPLPELW